MGTAFEKVDCLQAQIIRAKSSKCKESVSLKNTNHKETYVVYMDTNMIKVICNFCDRAFGSWNFCGTRWCHKSYFQVIAKQMASVLFTIGGSLMNALAFSGTLFFSKLIDQSEKEQMEWK